MIIQRQLPEEFNRIKKNIFEYISPRWSKKKDDGEAEYVPPLINVVHADKLIHNSPLLHKVIRVLAQDVILNNYTLDIPNIQGNDDNPEMSTEELELEIFNNFWNDANKFQFYLAAQEAYTFGYGAAEIRYNINDEPIKLEQIPAMTIQIRRKTIAGEKYTYVEQTIDDRKELLRIAIPDASKGTDYSRLDMLGIDDGSTGKCIWLGGGTTSTWYNEPYWFDANTSILTSIYIDELNYDKISSGNIPSGVMLFEGSYRKQQESFESQIERQISKAGSGTAIICLEGMTPDSDVDAEYIKLEDENYEYLRELRKECISTILEAYGVPKVRLMIDDITESMNSSKSVTLYEIYNKSILSEQYQFKQLINGFNRAELGLHYDCVMDTPEFNDKTNIKINTIISVFEEGLITLGQAVESLSRLLPEMNFDNLLDTPQQLACRYYKGSLLGSNEFTDPFQMDGMTAVTNLQQMLAERGENGLFQ